MPRTAHATDFFVEVDKIGRLCFARRTLADQLLIRGRYNAATEGNYDVDGNMADIAALAYVTIQTLLVSGFDIETIDPLMDDEWDTKIMSVWRALREKELSFRPNKNVVSQAAGSEGSEQPSAVVSG